MQGSGPSPTSSGFAPAFQAHQMLCCWNAPVIIAPQRQSSFAQRFGHCASAWCREMQRCSPYMQGPDSFFTGLNLRSSAACRWARSVAMATARSLPKAAHANVRSDDKSILPWHASKCASFVACRDLVRPARPASCYQALDSFNREQNVCAA